MRITEKDYKELKKGDVIIGVSENEFYKLASGCIDGNFYFVRKIYKNKNGKASVRRQKQILPCRYIIDWDLVSLDDIH